MALTFKERKELKELSKKLTGVSSSWQKPLKRGILQPDVSPEAEAYCNPVRLPKAPRVRPIKVSKRHWPIVEEVKQKMIDELKEKNNEKPTVINPAI